MKLPDPKDFLLRSTYKTTEQTMVEYAEQCIEIIMNEMTETCLESYKRGYRDGGIDAQQILNKLYGNGQPV